jgi:hypothetical protein
MCGLCGVLGDGTHWADGLAAPGEPPGEPSSASAVPWLRRQARRRRVEVGNVVLRHYGLSLADWQGTSFILKCRTGGTEMVAGLGELWPKAERLCGAAIDPLDTTLLDAVDGACNE